jgi:hypothetical protein
MIHGMIHTSKFEKSHGRPPANDISGMVRIEWTTALGRGPFFHTLNVTSLDDLTNQAMQFLLDMEEYTSDMVRVHILP